MQRHLRTRFAALAVLAGACFPLLLVMLAADGCGSEGVTGGAGGGVGGESSSTGTGSGGTPAMPVTVTLFPDAAPLPGESECKVVETTGIAITAMHIPLCTPIAYATNPPSGGDHWGSWTTYAKHETPVPREMYVHNMEHGAVVLAYRCKDPCPDVVAALGKAFDEAADTFCLGQATPTARVVLTPDPELDAPIAVVAWGATYVATCIDESSLHDFVGKVIDHGTEKVCADGVPPEIVTASCADGGADAGEGGDPDGGG